MSLIPSTMPDLGLPAPAFSLPDTDGQTVSLESLSDSPALLIAFWCNHCPYVKHIRASFADFAREYQAKGLAVVAINANDADTHPGDSPAAMRTESQQHGFSFPYLYDESQSVAHAYRAACTPDFFLYDAQRTLAYRGQFDGSRPGNGLPVSGEDMRRAVDAVLAGDTPAGEQIPSIGCNIKWKPD
jgi:peroxiredoxin